MKESRKFPRYEFPIEVKYYPPEDSSKHSFTIASNISLGGIRMPVISDIVKQGNTINLEILLGQGSSIPAVGAVKWIKMSKREALLDEEVGIEFIKVSPAKIKSLIDHSGQENAEPA